MSAEAIAPLLYTVQDTGVSLFRLSAGEFAQAVQTGLLDSTAFELRSGVAVNRWTGERHRWTVTECGQVEEWGWFGEQAIELIEGEVYVKLTQKPLHYNSLRMAARTLEGLLGAGYNVRQQGPLQLSENSQVTPDILVVTGAMENYAERHPLVGEVVFLLEVSDSTLWYDKAAKASLYAEAGIADYWILNLNARVLMIHREPVRNAEGFSYRSLFTYAESDSVAPLALPPISIQVRDLLPPISAAP